LLTLEDDEMPWLENRPTRQQRKRKENSFRVVWRDGGRRFQCLLGNVSEREAKRAQKGIEVGVYPEGFEMPEAPLTEDLTVTGVVSYWLDTDSKPFLRSHEDNVSRVSRHIVPALGERDVRELTKADCEEFFCALRSKPLTAGAGTGKRDQGRTLSLQTVNHVQKLLRQTLQLAVERGLIRSNPMDGVKPFKTPAAPDAHIKYVLTPAEVARVMALDKPSLRFVCIVAIYTGMRRGEIFALRWLDYDTSGTHPVLHVRRSYNDGTKGSRLRDVPAIPELTETLLEWQRMWPVQSGTGRLPRGDDLIFPVDGSGGKMRSRAAKYGLVDSIREATGRDDLVFHDIE
jgi:integrase